MKAIEFFRFLQHRLLGLEDSGTMDFRKLWLVCSLAVHTLLWLVYFLTYRFSQPSGKPKQEIFCISIVLTSLALLVVVCLGLFLIPALPARGRFQWSRRIYVVGSWWYIPVLLLGKSTVPTLVSESLALFYVTFHTIVVTFLYEAHSFSHSQGSFTDKGDAEQARIRMTPVVDLSCSLVVVILAILYESLGWNVPVAKHFDLEVYLARPFTAIELVGSLCWFGLGNVFLFTLLQFSRLRCMNIQLSQQLCQKKTEEKLTSQSTFFACLVHEIRTPLTGALAMIELLHHTVLSRTQAEHVSALKSSGEALQFTVNNILDFMKMTQQNIQTSSSSSVTSIQLDQKEFSLRRCIERVVEIQQGCSVGKKVPIVVNVNKSVPDLVVGDQKRLDQVLLNLTSNAIKFSPKNGQVNISVYCERHRRNSESPRDNGFDGGHHLILPPSSNSTCEHRLTSLLSSKYRHSAPDSPSHRRELIGMAVESSSEIWPQITSPSASASESEIIVLPAPSIDPDLPTSGAADRITSVLLYFEVTDTGVGLEPEELSKLFKEYTQVGSSASSPSGGRYAGSTGLGLYLCKQLVTRWKGEIRADSQGLGHGTTITFTYPLTAKHSEYQNILHDTLLAIRPDQRSTALPHQLLAEERSILTCCSYLSNEVSRIPFTNIEQVRRTIQDSPGRNILVVVVTSTELTEQDVQILSGFGGEDFDPLIPINHGVYPESCSIRSSRRILPIMTTSPSGVLPHPSEESPEIRDPPTLPRNSIIGGTFSSDRKKVGLVVFTPASSVAKVQGLPQRLRFHHLPVTYSKLVEALMGMSEFEPTPIPSSVSSFLTPFPDRRSSVRHSSVGGLTSVNSQANTGDSGLNVANNTAHTGASSNSGLLINQVISKPTLLLIVDDNAVNRLALRHMLQQYGFFHCEEAETGDQALQQCTEKQYPVFMDCHMPEGSMDGYEASMYIRDIPSYERVPIIAVTGVAMMPPSSSSFTSRLSCEGERVHNLHQYAIAEKDVEHQRCYDSRMSHILPKPFTLASLKDALTSVGLM